MLLHEIAFIIPLEARLWSNIGNTLWCVSTVFTHLAITPLEVNQFGLNLGHSKHIVCRWPWQILGAISAEATARERGECLFFVRYATHDFNDFPRAKFHKIYTQDMDR